MLRRVQTPPLVSPPPAKEMHSSAPEPNHNRMSPGVEMIRSTSTPPVSSSRSPSGSPADAAKKNTEREKRSLLGHYLPPSLSKTETALKYFGWTCTLLAMSAQGFQGMMLMDYLVFRKLPFYWRIVLDLIFIIAVEESKRRIVTKHNEEEFVKVASTEWKKTFNPFNWKLKTFLWQALINIPLTIGGTYVFVAVTGWSLDADVGGASLLNTYNKHFFSKTANILNSRGFQIPFMMAAMFANLLFFPTMIILAYNNLKSWAFSPFETAEYRSLKEQVVDHIEAKRRKLKTAYEGDDKTRVNNLLTLINTFIAATKTLQDEQPTYQGIQSVVPNTLTPTTPTKNVQRVSLALLTMMGAAVGCIGFFSIYQLGGKPAAMKMIRVFSTSTKSNFIKLAPVLSVLSYAATMAICIALAPSLLREIPRFRLWANESAQIKVSSSFGLWVNAFKALFICSLGTTPFIFQAYRILNEDLWLIIMVGIASLSIEAQAAREKCAPVNHGKSTWYGEAAAYFGSFFTRFRQCCRTEEEKRTQRKQHQHNAAVEKADRGLIALQNDTHVVEHIINKHVGFNEPRYRSWVPRLFWNRTKSAAQGGAAAGVVQRLEEDLKAVPRGGS